VFKVGVNSIQQAKAILTEAPHLAAQVEACALSLADAYEAGEALGGLPPGETCRRISSATREKAHQVRWGAHLKRLVNRSRAATARPTSVNASRARSLPPPPTPPRYGAGATIASPSGSA